MLYRKFGNTGVSVSALGFGAMRLPKDEDQAIQLLHRAMDLGVNYLDTAPAYGDSELVVGKALASYTPTAPVYISTKNPLEDNTAEGWRARLERSLTRLQVSKVHFYQSVHGMNWKAFQENFSVSGAMQQALKAKEEGLIDHICFSFHDSPENLIKLVDTGFFAGCTVQYNLLDRSCEDAITYASEKGMGVVVMGPIGGGRLMQPSENVRDAMGADTTRTPQIALRFVLANAGVTTAISGMSDLEMLEENVQTASSAHPLSAAEWEDIKNRAASLQKLGELYCTGCGYCTPCPNDVSIPEIIRLYNFHKVWEQTDMATRAYNQIGKEGSRIKGKPGSECLLCGECEPKCPQNLPIMDTMQKAEEELRMNQPG